MIWRAVISAIFLASCGAAYSAPVAEKGMATVSIASTKAASADERNDALRKAKINAIERYLSQGTGARMKNYEQVRGRIENNIDEFVLQASVLDEQVDAGAKRYSIVVRAELNTVRIDNLVKGSSAVAKAGAAKSPLTFIFVAREQGSVQRFDTREFKREDRKTATGGQTEKALSERNDESQSGGTAKVAASMASREATNTNSSITVETGGSKTQQADKITYRVTQSGEINSAMTNVFSNTGFDVVEAEFLEQESKGGLSVTAFRADFSQGNDLSSKTLRGAADGARAAGVAYIAIGTLDVGVKDADPVSGLDRIYVTVTGKVYDVTGRFPKTVAAVGPLQFAGLGPNSTVARTNALNDAASRAANELAEQLNSKGVQ